MKNLRVRSFINEVFDFYADYFQKVFSFCILLTSVFLIIVALLFRYSNFGLTINETWATLYHAFFNRYSTQGTYSIVDLSKTIYLFFAALLALSVFSERNSTENSGSSVIKSLNILDIAMVFIFFCIACGIDVGFYFTEFYTQKKNIHPDSSALIHTIIFELRLYVPVIMLAIVVSQRILLKRGMLSWYAFFTLIISAWLFNEFAYELSALIRNFIFIPITINISNVTTKNIVESILCVPLFAAFLPGYACVLYLPLSYFQKQTIIGG